jgi:site-specific recombinase XerD
MNVLNLIRESGYVRIPFTFYNPVLFRCFISAGGKWDSVRHEFIFDGDVDVKHINNIIQMFFSSESSEESEEDSSEIPAPVKKATVLPVSPFSFPVSSSLPDKLSVQLIEKLEAELRSRKYSVQTRRAYIYYNRLICRTLQKTPEEIRPDDVTKFLALMEKDNKYSASALNLAISAIKFFFKFILKKDDIAEKHRPRHDGRLPMILSKEEISRILSLEKNPKHRLLLMLVYSSGLRVSEVVTLRKEHIDLSRKVIFIRLGKGRKDRSTLLSEKAAQYIVEYYKYFNIEKWIFPGNPSSNHLSIRSAQQIFDKAVRRAEISKEISIHNLRHTFATHLLESGTDIRYIQTLLGHSSLRTTERYTHVARRNVLNIKSPLDTIP